MGAQGEIFNILGLKLPVIELEPEKLYSLNGKTIALSEDRNDKPDFIDGFMCTHFYENRGKPKLGVKVLGVDKSYGTRGNYDAYALAGYAIANECYVASATKLPPYSKIEQLKPRLVEDIKSKLGIDVKQSELELFLLFEFVQ